MKTVPKTVYQYSELSEEAQEKARDWYREASMGDNFFAEYVIEDAVRMGALMGIEIDNRTWRNTNGHTGTEPKIWWSGFSSQGDGASFEGSYHYVKGAVKKIKAEANDGELIRIAEQLQAIQKKYFYKLYACVRRGAGSNYHSHSNTMSIDVEYTGEDYREVETSDEEDIAQLMRDFADWIYSNLEKEYEYQNSDTAVEETILANEYEFNEDGTIA